MSPPVRKSRERRPWVVIFILLSLIAHLLFVLAIVLISHFMPKPEIKAAPQEVSSTTLSLQPPQPLAPPPKPKHIFMPTEPDAAAKHKETLVESDNDTRLKSQSQAARTPDSIAPDIKVTQKHGENMRQAPNSPAKPTSNPSAASPGQKSQPQQNVSTQPPTPAPPPKITSQSPKPTPPSPSKEQVPEPSKNPTPGMAKQQYDPNGLPVLPALAAPTIAPISSHQEARPISSQPETTQDSRGAIGIHGDNSPEAMKSPLGMYKAKVYRSIGSLWHHKVDNNIQYMGVGLVHVQFTIHQDGTVETKVLEGDTGQLQSLLAASVNAIREGAPYDPFPPEMVKDVGESYTDDCTFTIYGDGD